MSKLETSIRSFVNDNFLFGHGTTHLGNADSFLEQGIIDSTGVLELVTFLEQTYPIQIDDAELVPENLDTIDNLVRFIEIKLAQAQEQC